MSYSWTGAIIIKRVRDAIILNFRRAFLYDTLYPYVLNLTLTPATGSVTLTNGSPFVVGTGTNFTTSVFVGNAIQFSSQAGITYYVQTVIDDTHLTLTTDFNGTSSSTVLNVGSNPTVNFDCTRIVINDSTPDDFFFLPSINVITASGDEHRFIQEDFFEEFEDVSGNQSARRGAPLDIRVIVEATALDIITRDQLVDRMYEKFKIITDDLANNGIGILRTSINADRKEFKNDRWYYTSGVTLYLYAEWLDEDITNPNSIATGIGGHITTDAGIDQPFKI